MESGNSLSMISLIMHASLPVQLIMALLVALSVISWSFIVSKLITLRAVGRSTDDFERTFWSGADLNSMYQRVSANQNSMGMEKIFQAGFGEFIKLRRQGGVELSDLMDGTRRAMKAAAQRELDELDRHTAFLATVGSVSPYIGLFGTVWGIMHAFIGLGNAGSATLSTVAPGIAEALIATAIGLFAAIPAVVAYNRFAHDTDRFATRFDTFGEEFSNILQRQAARSHSS
ncbi:protein TolQ [Rivihabitans pingtungensis]|uniref:protein TolQ n=1 Tax=Rivihabitans pingtungensis TaxID=1054498 RepID=UPI002D1FA78A|nr:protein TolQ [Rivihabitans pingtungensis]